MMAKFDAKMWDKLLVLGGKQGSIKLIDLAKEMNLCEEDALVFLRHFFPEGKGAQVYFQDEASWVDIDADAIQYMLPLTPGEWIQLHQTLNGSVQIEENPALQSLKKKVSDSGPIRAVMEMLDHLQIWDQDLTPLEQKFVQTLDEASKKKELLQITASDEKVYTVFPCKVVHLEGQLSLIAEDFHDHCLMVFSVKDLTEAMLIPTSAEARSTQYELEEFIGCIRAMNEKETRLILKICDPEKINLFPDFHFLGKPCMITNPNGDLIWAAYVEPCEALFDWVATLGTQVEILDPTKFKDQYLKYCEDKLRKIA
jgi:hypothetical protein